MMCTRNDITLVQRWICLWRGKEEHDDYLSQIDLGPDNNVADMVTRLEEAGYELEKNSRGDYVVDRSIRGACNAADGGTVGSDPVPENIRLTAVAATTECAAGMMCTAPPGAKLSESPHHCLDCRRKIHTAIWCGKNWGEYVDSSVCKITANQLSIAGRESIHSIGHEMLTICYNCVNPLKSTTTSESTLATIAEREQTLLNNPIATCLKVL